MPETERFAVPLQKSVRPTIASIEETLNNAVAAYAVKHRLLIEEVAAYFQGFAVGAKECVAVYLVCQRPMSATERASIRKCAAEKARKAAAWPITNGKADPARSCYVLDSEIKATKVPEGYQFLLA